MNLYKLFLIAAALLPAVVLCAYVYKKDRVEKEPVSLLLMLLLMGAISCLPIAFIEEFLSVVLDRIFLPFGVLGADGEKYILVANFGDNEAAVEASELSAKEMLDLVGSRKIKNLTLGCGEAVLLKAIL